MLSGIARLKPAEHDAARGWQPGLDAVWGAIPGDVPIGVVPLFSRPELVAHQDYCPGNVVFRDHQPVAFIDFDLARPTTRLADAVNALYWWVPLLHPQDRPLVLIDADIPARIRAFADAYGMSDEQRNRLVPLAIQRARNVHLTARAAADVDPVFRRFWEEGVKDRKIVVAVESGAGPLRMLGSPMRFDGVRAQYRPPPRLHEHTDELRGPGELGSAPQQMRASRIRTGLALLLFRPAWSTC